MKRSLSGCTSLVVLLLVLFCWFPTDSVQAQNVVNQCGWHWKWVWKWVPKTRYNGATGRYESTTDYDYVYDYVYDCELTVAATEAAAPRSRSASHPNTVRNSDGTLRPANGYRWVNSKDPNDFRVKPKPGLIETEPGTLRPAGGYQWANPDDPKDFRVEPKQGLIESEPGTLRPAQGYRWVNNDDPKDFRVERIPTTRRTSR